MPLFIREIGVRINLPCLMTNHIHIIEVPETEAGLTRTIRYIN